MRKHKEMEKAELQGGCGSAFCGGRVFLEVLDYLEVLEALEALDYLENLEALEKLEALENLG